MGFTEQQAYESMASAMQERGLATTEQIQVDRAVQPWASAAGEQPAVTDATNLQADAVDPVAAQMDQDIFSGPSSPAGYHFIAPPPNAQHDPAQAQAVAAAFFDAGLPASIAQQADRLYNEAFQSPPTAEQIESGRQSGMQQLTHTFGEKTQQVIAVAQKEFARMAAKAPQLRAMAEASGLGNSASLIASLYFHASAKGRGSK